MNVSRPLNAFLLKCALLSIGRHCDNPAPINVAKTLAMNIPVRTGHNEELSIGAKYEAEAFSCPVALSHRAKTPAQTAVKTPKSRTIGPGRKS
jgi:hypothetical protein